MKASHRLPNDGSCMTNGHAGVIIIVDIERSFARLRKKAIIAKKNRSYIIIIQNIIIYNIYEQKSEAFIFNTLCKKLMALVSCSF